MRHVVRAVPALVHGRVGAQHVVVGQQVPEAEFLGPLRVAAHRRRVWADLGLREDDADLHAASSVGLA